ncbi:restriction endonuclease subunit S [[Ruminococcus] lactaris]|jgi:restriction endonuclease S subunit|nr:restriction endonuclease subunit S [[Ruminococcus] lactaris]MCB5819497.1 restriction endonuclease subunit S [[Ruminococcus] lactaris]
MKLEDCCEILDSQRVPITGSDRTSGDYPYYGANGIQDYVDDFIFDDELVLLAEDGGNFGSKTRPIAYRVSGKCWVNNHAHVLKPKAGLDVDYLCYSLMFYDVGGMVNGATRQKLTQAAMRQMIIPKRSLDEQIEIVNIIKKVQGVIASRKEELEQLDLLIKARFVEMFYEKGYPVLKWNDVFITTTGKLDSNASVEKGAYPFFTCSKELLRIDTYAFDQEALLLAGNNAAGKYDVKYYAGKFNAYQRTYVLSLKENWSYRLFQYQLEDKLEYLQQQSLGGLTKYLTLKILGELEFVIPPEELQSEFEIFVTQVTKSKVAVQKALDETQILFDSLMQEYFG